MAVKWKLRFSEAGDTHSLLYRAEVHGKGVQAEIHTKKNKRTGEFGKERRAFFIDGDKREFKTEADMLAALREMGAIPAPTPIRKEQQR